MFSVFVICLIMMNIASLYSVIELTYDETYNQADLHIAAKQISQEIIDCREAEVYTDLIFINSEDVETTITLDDERIVKTPGFEIFVYDVDDLEFEIKNHFIYMIVTRDNEDYRFLIGSDIE